MQFFLIRYLFYLIVKRLQFFLDHIHIHIHTRNHKSLNISHICNYIYDDYSSFTDPFMRSFRNAKKTINEDGRIFYKLTIVLSL